MNEANITRAVDALMDTLVKLDIDPLDGDIALIRACATSDAIKLYMVQGKQPMSVKEAAEMHLETYVKTLMLAYDELLQRGMPPEGQEL